MIEGNVAMTRIATVAAMAIRAWRLVFFPDGPEPHVQIDRGDISPFSVDSEWPEAFRPRSTHPGGFCGPRPAKRVPRCGVISYMSG